MSVETIIAIFRFLLWLAGVVMDAYNALTPEEKEQAKQAHDEWMTKCRGMKDPMGGNMEGP